MRTYLLLISFFVIQTSSSIKTNSVDGISIGMDIDTFFDLKKDDYIIKKSINNIEGDDFVIYNVYSNFEIIYAIEPDDNNEVWRIWLYGKEFKTDLGIGVGNTLGDLREMYSVIDFETGEGNVAIFIKELNVSFLLNTKQIPSTWWNNMSLEKLNDNILINLIIV